MPTTATRTRTRPSTAGQTQTVVYPNQQDSTLLWYHDHADQITRTNMYAVLVGLYIIRDAQDTGAEPNPIGLPGGACEVPLVLSDKLFDDSGQLFYSDTSTWIPEFYGDTPVVNGAARPYMNVSRGSTASGCSTPPTRGSGTSG